jgi:hypothetical protein
MLRMVKRGAIKKERAKTKYVVLCIATLDPREKPQFEKKEKGI